MATSHPTVELAGLSKAYRPVHAVRGLDLMVAPGETRTDKLSGGQARPGRADGGQNHLSAAMGKLGPDSWAAAVRIATDQGWLH